MASLVARSFARRPLAAAAATRLGVSSRQFAAFSRTIPIFNEDELPYHIVVGMPALSPTMEAGSLAEWYVKEGDSFIAGDSLAKIETDKASIDFEAQDDGYVAKLLAEAGGSDEITVGVPIMVTVEEEEDITAFADYKAPAAAPAPAAPAKEEAVAPPPPPPAPKVEAAVAPAAATPPPPAPAATPPPPAPAADAPASVAAIAKGWGQLAKDSPLAKTLSKQQTQYIESYGTTGQVPL
ncbi:acetyltransferase component of pyruvate dehydrogenase complex, mitochondrial [Seminavis robusta]|uniref:Acetyltransferase component of pyruvate dehydrogenase complex, mitochondrial n=1 Tax=Seminavis robusta TaxID=568900 RepID=A0A9N8DC90_9STRA|nr:acetyltransferase component of pyruvate dehydrogenase complex, mitochondrial [Seminavis robusta]|eukprot:Sro54_g031840.1 acetyltransferase component of pyruvate dehydrogenase complex, mitochondrial (238) ;mRNA; r:60701-61414